MNLQANSHATSEALSFVQDFRQSSRSAGGSAVREQKSSVAGFEFESMQVFAPTDRLLEVTSHVVVCLHHEGCRFT